MIEILIDDQGSLVGFTPLTDDARQFMDNERAYEGWQVIGSTVWVDHRSAIPLLDAIEDEGFIVKSDHDT